MSNKYRPHFLRLSLGFRIIAVAIFPVGAFLLGLFYVDQYRETVFNAELMALERQGETLAQTIGLTDAGYSQLAQRELSQDTMQQVAQLIASIPDARIRVFQPDGSLILDSVSAIGLAAPQSAITTTLEISQNKGSSYRLMQWVRDWVNTLSTLMSSKQDYPLIRETRSDQAADYPGVSRALAGEVMPFIARDRAGQVVLGIAVPIRNLRVVRGALLITASGDQIEKDVAAVQYSFFQISIGVLFATILIAYYLSRSITRPISQLAKAADQVRVSNSKQIYLPRLTNRSDEIGELARDITLMTKELQERAVATAGFAADVAHEIKNPLTSLKSAVETMERLKDPDQQKRLLEVIHADVIRLDRLITDISAASRIDHDMTEAEYETLNLNDMVAGFAQSRQLALEHLNLQVISADHPVPVRIAVDRIVQILDNLLTNAASFSPPDSCIQFTVATTKGMAVVSVTDQGPGIPENKLNAIFDRFYSERPSGEGFGQHSGLGLSISLKIAEAHGGSIEAFNVKDDKDAITGAGMRLTLPLSSSDNDTFVS
ncbi:MAG: HAMP domain-containing protein [Alphaproteobacteria bacterium]|nr:HAMP domain-containing protein [Alphaproteobacteria bacterium]MDG2467402.1 stimulus-sensing domain-containing protein [Alphaproteobacteria bacterium]